MANLTTRQKAFADEYIINGGNATQAAIKAGYSKKTAEATASRLLRNVKVVEYIASKVAPVIEKRNTDVQEQLNSLLDIYDGKTIISRSKQIDHLEGNKIVKDMTYEYTPDLENRLKAIDLFLKYASPLLKAQLEKAQAEAAILRDKANKLSEDAQQNELLDALVNLPVVESDIDADKV